MTELMVGTTWLEIYQTSLGIIFMLCSFLSSLPSLFTPSPLRGPLSPSTERPLVTYRKRIRNGALYRGRRGYTAPSWNIWELAPCHTFGIGGKPDTSFFLGGPHPQLWVKDVPPRPVTVGGGLEVTSLHSTCWAISPITGFSHWAAPNTRGDSENNLSTQHLQEKGIEV